MKRSTSPASVTPARDTEPEADLAGALHEVSNALTVVLGWLDLAYGKVPDGDGREAIDIARTHAKLGHHIARSAIGAELVESEGAQRSAQHVARSAALGVRPQAERRGVSIVVEAEDIARIVVRDPSAALQILTNLLLNAIEFSPEGSVVTVGLRDTRTSVVFSVSDQGPGIEPERVETLLSAPVSTRRGGAGVGLRHSAALAQSHDGELKVTRHSPGACFELRWPVAEARSSARPSAPTKHVLGGVRILVVEDDAAVCALVDLALSARGAEVTIANTRDQFAKELAAGTMFDAALVDLSPLGDSAAHAISELRTSNPEMAVILISGVASGAPEAVAHQVIAWVRKPFEMGEILDVLAGTLKRQSEAPSSLRG